MSWTPAAVRLAPLLVYGSAMVCAGCDPGAAEIEVHRNSQCLAAAGRVYLFTQVAGEQQDMAVCFRHDPVGGWSKQGEFRANYSAVATDETKFLLFLPKSVIALHSGTYTRMGQAEWSFNWRVQSAHVLAGTLLAFGVGGDESVGYTLYCARAPLTKTISRFEPRDVTSEPARSGADSRLGFLEEEWRVDRLLVEEQRALEHVRAVIVGTNCWLFYSTRERGTGQRMLHAAVLQDGQLNRTANLLTTDGPLEFAATEKNGEPAVFVAALPRRLKGDAVISLHRLDSAEGRWLAPQQLDATKNPPGERTRAMSACWLDGRVHLFLETDFRVLRVVGNGGWCPPETVVANPAVDWMLRHVGVLAAVSIIAVVALGASFVRSRFLPRRAVIANVQYEFAPWLSRGAAYLCDLFIIVIAAQTMLVFVGKPLGTLHMAIAVFCFELAYFSILESHTGKTVGKRILGIMVVSRNGGYPNGSEALMRNLVRALADSLFLGLGWVVGSVILLNTRGAQRLGDLAAGTYVVKERRAG